MVVPSWLEPAVYGRCVSPRQVGRRGKSGSLRICYAHFPDFGTVALITLVAKNEHENLSADEKKQVAALIKRIEESLAQENSHEK